jgi:predicted RNA binding protein YcfA (HicA-like mRNA interferase family)
MEGRIERLVIPIHGNQAHPRQAGTFKAILKQAGISEEEFREL